MNYITEGNINFTNELLNMICKDKEIEGDNPVEQCLISSEPLLDTHVILQCGHKFNYVNIMEEIKRQRYPSHLEIQRLCRYQIKCPYCRTVHNNLIPYCEMDGIISKHGVTKPHKYVLLPDKCIYIFKSGKKKKQICDNKCTGMYCKTHKNLKHKKPLSNELSNEPSNEPSNELCNCILKTGKRKGNKCERINCKYHK